MDTSTVTQEGTPIHDGPENGRSRTLSPSVQGGLGTDVLGKRNHRSNGDVRIVARAIREEWDIPDDKRAEVIDTLYHEMRNSDQASIRVMAAKAIIAANAQNVAARSEGKPVGNTTYNYTLNVMEAGAEAARLLQGQPLPPPPSVQPGSTTSG